MPSLNASNICPMCGTQNHRIHYKSFTLNYKSLRQCKSCRHTYEGLPGLENAILCLIFGLLVSGLGIIITGSDNWHLAIPIVLSSPFIAAGTMELVRHGKRDGDTPRGFSVVLRPPPPTVKPAQPDHILPPDQSADLP